jgi:hypothetical protein
LLASPAPHLISSHVDIIQPIVIIRILEKEAKRGQRKTSIQQYDWVNQLRAIEIDQPIPSPLKYEYRNKCEFTIGWRLVPGDRGDGGDNSLMPTTTGGGNEGVDAAPTAGDGITKEGDDSEVDATANLNTTTNSSTSTTVEFRKVPAAGFLPQGWNGGVYPPHPLQNMPDWSCGIADIFNDFLPTSSIPPYDSKVHRITIDFYLLIPSLPYSDLVLLFFTLLFTTDSRYIVVYGGRLQYAALCAPANVC